LEKSGDIDIYVIRGEGETAPFKEPPAVKSSIPWVNYLATLGVVALCGLLGWLSQAREANLVMIFLLGVVLVSARYGRGPSIVSAVASVLTFDFFFVPPYFSFAVSDAQYVLTFAVMLGIGLLISTLTVRIREQLQSSQQQERRTAALYRLTKQLSEVAGSEFLILTAGRQLVEIFDGEMVVYVREPKQNLTLRFGENTSIAALPVNGIVAQWVADHDQTAGLGTDTLPNATALFVPLIGSQRTVGALGVKPGDEHRFLDPEQRRLLETCASLIALSIERDESVLAAHQAWLQVQSEQLRNSLLSSVSHDLRTPLAAIAGAAFSLLETMPPQDNLPRRELLQTVVDESRRLTRLVDNLLDITRLESGAVELNKQWHVLEEIVGSALSRFRQELEHHPVRVDIPRDFPLLAIDGTLIEQAIVNLLENSIRYTPAGSEIEVRARIEGDHAIITMADTGPGLPPGTEQRVCETFCRGPRSSADGRRGVGLGLAICQGIIRAHGGRISARNRPGGGAEFLIALPYEPMAPRVALEETAPVATP
jgi:two-component system sensor histidine kinase KdpD